jgi:hypothetical protein
MTGRTMPFALDKVFEAGGSQHSSLSDRGNVMRHNTHL